ncbi:MAG: mechanosensitive ion channel family protein [Bacilli bacterium]|nr:mechanosensitive ion channel family protein [Bacilli bacterium]
MKEKKKINTMGLIILIIGIAISVCSIVLSTQIYGVASVFNQPLTGIATLDLIYSKIPAVIRTIEIITIAYLLNMLISFILSKLFSNNKRGKTITKLLTSFIKYLIAIVAILLALSAFGVDTKTLLASAGILGLVIGLGAQSLISDIIAGVFIVFEGEFEVGDIVVIDDWRGTVDEIGIRTTKIIDYGGNIKIVNNSQIQTIINQTKELSLARATISIEYGKPIPEAEEVIMKNLDNIKAKIPEIVEGPYYKGVNALAASSVDLLFVAKCKEEDLYGVQRAMNRELKILFDENGIGIPFPQVTISELASDNDKKSLGKEQKKEVDKFVKGQRTASKDLEEIIK